MPEGSAGCAPYLSLSLQPGQPGHAAHVSFQVHRLAPQKIGRNTDACCEVGRPRGRERGRKGRKAEERGRKGRKDGGRPNSTPVYRVPGHRAAEAQHGALSALSPRASTFCLAAAPDSINTCVPTRVHQHLRTACAVCSYPPPPGLFCLPASQAGSNEIPGTRYRETRRRKARCWAATSLRYSPTFCACGSCCALPHPHAHAPPPTHTCAHTRTPKMDTHSQRRASADAGALELLLLDFLLPSPG